MGNFGTVVGHELSLHASGCSQLALTGYSVQLVIVVKERRPLDGCGHSDERGLIGPKRASQEKPNGTKEPLKGWEEIGADSRVTPVDSGKSRQSEVGAKRDHAGGARCKAKWRLSS